MIALSQYPQLRFIAWNRRDTDVIGEAEAFALYESNWRFVDVNSMTADEHRLLDMLTKEYGHGVLLV